MNNTALLVVAMAEQCRAQLLSFDTPNPNLPWALQPQHLLWMCDRIESHAEGGPATKLHRWIGFIQCAMMAQHIIDLQGAKAMFDKAKIAHGDLGEDLVDHLNPASDYEIEIGGEA